MLKRGLVVFPYLIGRILWDLLVDELNDGACVLDCTAVDVVVGAIVVTLALVLMLVLVDTTAPRSK
ncbi:hypothetical protein K0M31_007205 [Melipona bicolor]|uniref:Uncharacterized protein n=1 Tax=Melipona bicolor TaxID=60889 RepID=A0AA40KVP7_9HYME|nr:hypothetical protein K0M31_007205 [Melipona bicolor]